MVSAPHFTNPYIAVLVRTKVRIYVPNNDHI